MSEPYTLSEAIVGLDKANQRIAELERELEDVRFQTNCESLVLKTRITELEAALREVAGCYIRPTGQHTYGG